MFKCYFIDRTVKSTGKCEVTAKVQKLQGYPSYTFTFDKIEISHIFLVQCKGL